MLDCYATVDPTPQRLTAENRSKSMSYQRPTIFAVESAFELSARHCGAEAMRLARSHIMTPSEARKAEEAAFERLKSAVDCGDGSDYDLCLYAVLFRAADANIPGAQSLIDHLTDHLGVELANAANDCEELADDLSNPLI